MGSWVAIPGGRFQMGSAELCHLPNPIVPPDLPPARLVWPVVAACRISRP